MHSLVSSIKQRVNHDMMEVCMHSLGHSYAHLCRSKSANYLKQLSGALYEPPDIMQVQVRFHQMQFKQIIR